ncbi:hypothetical protein CLOSTHATH_05502 [Hungatella hathewayi DSM 13479]|uniref:Uncharacterized protein n=1 Tax=Hungatella hathewayi DSM 13479 TaxID=566550 RepID=D3APF0_9FIRM|nr:hypothetical protein CLOSTHATH_05502 [Hungatella hathewayi DSM 13479]
MIYETIRKALSGLCRTAPFQMAAKYFFEMIPFSFILVLISKSIVQSPD